MLSKNIILSIKKCIFNDKSPFHSISRALLKSKQQILNSDTLHLYFTACDPISILNGETNYSSSAANDWKYPSNTLAFFECNYRFTLHPDIEYILDFISLLRNSGYTGFIASAWTCQDSGNWTRETPKCVLKVMNLTHFYSTRLYKIILILKQKIYLTALVQYQPMLCERSLISVCN